MTATRFLQVDPRDPNPAALKEAATVLARRGLVAFPTETFYALGANALDAAAVRRVALVKGRSEAKPLLVLVDSMRMVESLVAEVPSGGSSLVSRYWPGPLTLVFKAMAALPEELTAGSGTLGVRMSSHPVAFGLVRASGVPVTAPSANLSGEAPATTAEEVRRVFDGRIELVLDGGPTTGGLPSTILDVTVTPPRMIRRGAVELDLWKR